MSGQNVLSGLIGNFVDGGDQSKPKRGRPPKKAEQKKEFDQSKEVDQKKGENQDIDEQHIDSIQEEAKTYDLKDQLMDEEDDPYTFDPAQYRIHLEGSGGDPLQKIDLLKGKLLKIIQNCKDSLASMGNYIPPDDITKNLPDTFREGKQRLKQFLTHESKVTTTLEEIQNLLYILNEQWPHAFKAAYAAEAYKLAKDVVAIKKATDAHVALDKKEKQKEETARNRYEKQKRQREDRRTAVQQAVMSRLGARLQK